MIQELYATICHRRDHPTPDSYTARLISQGEDEIIKKIGEESVEIILAAKSQGDQRLVEEIADLTYHVLVLMAARKIPLQAVEEELVKRRR